jgi:hypothetical protein
MKKYLCVLLFILSVKLSVAQSQRVIGPAEKRISDSVCNCLSKLDMSKITTSEQAKAAFEGCFESKADLILEVAKERNVDLTDHDGMRKVGMDIALTMMKGDCSGFMKLAMLMAKDKVEKKVNEEEATDDTSQGTLKRIDNKGFNYFVITDSNGSEKSFIWLRQFPESEKFNDGLGS